MPDERMNGNGQVNEDFEADFLRPNFHKWKALGQQRVLSTSSSISKIKTTQNGFFSFSRLIIVKSNAFNDDIQPAKVRI